MFESENPRQRGHHFSRFVAEKMFHHLGDFRTIGCLAAWNSVSIQPPAIAPTIRNGSAPLTTASGNRRLRRFERQIFLAGKKPDERPALQRAVVANRPAQHRITRFKRVEHRAHRDRRGDFKLHLAVHARQVAQMKWQHDANS